MCIFRCQVQCMFQGLEPTMGSFNLEPNRSSSTDNLQNVLLFYFCIICFISLRHVYTFISFLTLIWKCIIMIWLKALVHESISNFTSVSLNYM